MRLRDAFLVAGLIFVACGAAASAAPRIRTIVTTDGEIDDRCSMARFLLYTNEWDVRGLILSSSVYHWKGDARTPGSNWEGEAWLPAQLDRYARVEAMLRRHDPRYPTAERLRGLVRIGNVATAGDMSGPTPGSELIVRELLAPDTSPIWLQAWGGANTIAMALKTIEEQHPGRRAEVIRKARLFLITQQDDTYRTTIRPRWPDLTVIVSEAFPAIAYDWRKIMPPEVRAAFDAPWMKRNILEGRGPLCAAYETHGDGSFISEGDSPAFLNLIDVGLGGLDHPSYGGWGGRFRKDGPHWTSTTDGRDPYAPILRWALAFQNDWAARAAWCVRPPDQANHPPSVALDGVPGTAVVTRKVKPGAAVRLSARGSKDPDGDALAYRWWVYGDAGTYPRALAIDGADRRDATLRVPADAAGHTLHVILEVRDSGEPALTRYRRVVVRVEGKAPASSGEGGPDEAYLRTPITRLGGPSGLPGRWTFYRGVNLAGPPVVIDGNRWEGDGAPGVRCANTPLNSPEVRLRPPTDAERQRMIHAFRWGTEFRCEIGGLPQGTYALFAYVWEDNNPEQFAISLNGQVVARHWSGVQGEWRRLRPWLVTPADGTIRVETAGGAANFSGIEVWRRSGG